ncbi:hypothetical protein K5L04_07465 [Flavobacterium psychrophilum]|uniref:hypothetical protein n=1 Tax=Flavobacterium psychrophilum TaxID=96345 RepID=UPI000B7C19CA|nr:hypothetical protein [Flavobacterium psychrophilum]EKT3957659.1 hypothetical protein [Flavobacterium psychrophilum]EKT4499951.1 hypothetical protein [Flavobacterium psychrophilum]EKT4510504.1 hypothetical protein [Flavobacterium psychrophilum]EKT4520729.1 hypothetical protein [Flavobacterium psychrophilum]EKT4553216.1 hypothetical protein [Flavobacterium psychrophilum]
MEFANKVFSLMFILILTSCSKDEPSGSIYIEASPILKINSSGEGGNFLNTINGGNVQLYYKKDGVLTLLTYPGTDNPKGYSIFQEAPINEKMIKVHCYIGGNNNQEETYIKWNESDIDTLSYNITRYESGSIGINSLKFNSVSISNNNENGIYNIIKN